MQALILAPDAKVVSGKRHEYRSYARRLCNTVERDVGLFGQLFQMSAIFRGRTSLQDPYWVWLNCDDRRLWSTQKMPGEC